jgi:hypothetical protein
MMNKKYWIHNQLTGLQEEALTYADALVLQQTIKDQLPEHAKRRWNVDAKPR